MTDSPIDRLMRVCFGLSAEDSQRTIDLLGADCFRFEPPDGTRPDAMLALWRSRQWFGGRPVPACAIAYVGTEPTARGRGCASRLLARTLREAHDAGDGVAVLYPANLPLYARCGFGRGGVRQRYAAAPACFGPARADMSPDVRMIPQRRFDADALARMQARAAPHSPGAMTRNEAMWTLALHPDGGERADIYLADGPDGPEGYLAVMPPRDDRLTVADHCLLTGRAAAAAANLLASYRGRVDRIVWTAAPHDPLLHMLQETGTWIESWEEWLLRVVNAPAALTNRGYPPNLTAELHLYIDDGLIAENSGVWRLRVESGQAAVTRTKTCGEHNIRLCITALASLFSGYLDAAALRRMGRLETDDRGLEIANSLFYSGLPLLSDAF